MFCQIVSRELAADVVWEDETTIMFLDRSPLFRGHTLVVPKRHAVTLADLRPDEVGPLFEWVRRVSAIMPTALGADGTFVASNNVVSQSVPHLHVHVVPRRKGDGLRGFFWPRERYGEGEPERYACRLREAIIVSPNA